MSCARDGMGCFKVSQYLQVGNGLRGKKLSSRRHTGKLRLYRVTCMRTLRPRCIYRIGGVQGCGQQTPIKAPHYTSDNIIIDNNTSTEITAKRS
jgi:hypothetical protein